MDIDVDSAVIVDVNDAVIVDINHWRRWSYSIAVDFNMPLILIKYSVLYFSPYVINSEKIMTV